MLSIRPMDYRAGDDDYRLVEGCLMYLPAAELRLPGADGLTPEQEVPRWIEVAGHYGLEVVGPPIPE